MIGMVRHGLLTALIGFSAVPALGCSIVPSPGYDGSGEQLRRVRQDIEQATAIVDGEVVRPWSGDQPALVRVTHVLKGEVGEWIEVGGPDAGADCSMALDRKGERRRMILRGSGKPYDLFRDGSEARLEDGILKSDRRKIWPYFAGQ